MQFFVDSACDGLSDELRRVQIGPVVKKLLSVKVGPNSPILYLGLVTSPKSLYPQTCTRSITSTKEHSIFLT